MNGIFPPRGGWPFKGFPNCDFDINWQSPQAEGLVGWWPLLGSPGSNTIRDYSGYNRHGTRNGAPTWINNGTLGTGLDFDANTEYVDVPDNAAFSAVTTSELSVFAWIKTTNLAATSYVISKYGAANFEYGLRINNAERVQAITWTLAGATNIYCAGDADTNLTIGEIALIGFRYKEDTIISILVNGFEGDTDVVVPNPGIGDGAQSVRWAVLSTGGSPYAGSMFDVRIHDRYVSDATVLAMWQPETRWELYAPRVRFWPGFVAAAPTTQLIMTTYAGYSQPVG